MTRSGVDLMIRGMMRSLSTDPLACHSCMKAYENIYFTVLSVELIIDQWQEIRGGIDGSYKIFKQIVNIYEQMDYVDTKCQHREMAY